MWWGRAAMESGFLRFPREEMRSHNDKTADPEKKETLEKAMCCKWGRQGGR